MTIAVNINSFDLIDYIRKLRNVGVSQEVAEVQAQEIDKLARNITTGIKAELKEEIREEMHSKELATKQDLEIVKLELQKEIEIVRKEISQNKNQIILWVVGIMTGYSVFFLGILAKGFHWF